MMLKLKEHKIQGYEKVIEAIDAEAGLHSIIAVHNTTLGPSLGGTRIYPYHTVDEALIDALRLSRGMTYKSALAEVGLGGGKSVIIADPRRDKTEKLLLAFGNLVEGLKGKYICAEDLGSTTDDMRVISKKTHYVAALAAHGSSGDPSPFTAWGVFRGMQAVGQCLWNSTSLHDRLVAVQGLGKVGMRLAEFLFWNGAHLVVSDINPDKVQFAIDTYGARAVSGDEIYGVGCDIFAPCALGGCLNDDTLPRLRCKAIAGSANNQLLDPQHGKELLERGIVYAPDFVINSGGLINASAEFDTSGYNPLIAKMKVDHIFDALMDIFVQAQVKGLPTSDIANAIAEHKIAYGIGKRTRELQFHHEELDRPAA